MKNKLKYLSILLSLILVLSSVAAVFAEEPAAPQTTDANIETGQNADENGTGSTLDEPEVKTPEGEGTENTEGEGTENFEGEGTENTEGEGTENLEGEGTETPEAPLATTDEETPVTITINCKYKGEEEPFKKVTKQCSIGDVIKAPTIVCAGNPTPAQIEVTAEVAAAGSETIEYTPVAPAKATLVLHPSYKSIIVTWKKVPGATKYVLQRSTQKDKGFKNLKTITDAKSSYTYKDTTAKGTVAPFSTARTYYYRVYAYSDKGKKSLSNKKSGSCVRPMYEQVTFKSGASLTSHDGKNKTKYFKAGQTIITQGFGGGKYKFWYDGYYFYANYVRVKNCKAKYKANQDGIVGKAGSYKGKWAKQDYAMDGSSSYKGINYYDKISAENFVNRCGKTSKTKYLIWVSTYQQHLYIFKGSKGKWKLYKDWECSTGAAKSPTPTGFDKAIETKWSTHSGIKWWSPFQHANSIHGQRSYYTFGRPQSNGCVRNFDQNAKLVYKECKPGTGLIVY